MGGVFFLIEVNWFIMCYFQVYSTVIQLFIHPYIYIYYLSILFWSLFHYRRKWQPTPVLLSGKSHGQRTLVGYSPRGCRVRHNWATEHRYEHPCRWICTPSGRIFLGVDSVLLTQPTVHHLCRHLPGSRVGWWFEHELWYQTFGSKSGLCCQDLDRLINTSVPQFLPL